MRLCSPHNDLHTFLHKDAEIHQTLEAGLIRCKISSQSFFTSISSLTNFFFSLHSPSTAFVQLQFLFFLSYYYFFFWANLIIAFYYVKD
ncbi:hypothetical protein RchiOBHm_Chr1g0322891 [Rosa chinensis]|uniref:Uncharacterized protein n=1 Tax=Rosa chinensis TaxID=74649 RepID=A0A2P6S9F9_ROSCH|nr:hypothetical protein RchiOBHm_Chr1g0322891 [Rosa chinensis]